MAEIPQLGQPGEKTRTGRGPYEDASELPGWQDPCVTSKADSLNVLMLMGWLGCD
jgi:hypothetical protein